MNNFLLSKAHFLIKVTFFCALFALTMTGCDRLEKLAETGDVSAQYRLAEQYIHGKNFTKAAYWYEKAATQGHIAAQVKLACLYYDGSGINQNYTKALELFKRASDTGKSSTADYYLAIMYMLGRGVERNYEKTAKYLINLVDQGDKNAIKLLAYMYYAGKGVPQSYEEAAKLYDRAYDSTSVIINMASMYEQGLGVPLDYDMADKLREKAVVMLVDLNKDSGSMTYNAIQGYSLSDTQLLTPYILANFYQFGLGGLSQDHEQARKLFSQARKKLKDTPYYETELAIMYHYGLGGKQDYVKAAELYVVGVTQDNEVAMLGLGELYEKGLGVEQNYAKAAELYAMAAKYGMAEKELGDLYAKGLGVELDSHKAFELYMNSAIKGLPEGQYALANAFFKGIGTKQNNSESWLWIQAAAKNRLVQYFYDDAEKGELMDNINQLLKEIENSITPEELEVIQTSLQSAW